MIELFKQPNLDWMGKAKYFYALSGILLLAGWTSILVSGGLRYGIDFKGGTNVDVRFEQPYAKIEDKLRTGLATQGLGNTEVQPISDIANPNANEVVIFVAGKNQDEKDLDASRVKVLNALNATFGVANSSKADFNSATPSTVAAVLTERDPLILSVNAGDRYQQLAKKTSRLSRQEFQRRARQLR
jgi:preprotein translocase subunit SecF